MKPDNNINPDSKYGAVVVVVVNDDGVNWEFTNISPGLVEEIQPQIKIINLSLANCHRPKEKWKPTTAHRVVNFISCIGYPWLVRNTPSDLLQEIKPLIARVKELCNEWIDKRGVFKNGGR